ncbi:MAG: cation diffusion facilitator family transporter [Erysipelotrichaceae bacterium]|nr:cation diffusion facilitator family transporter [Erysipelotrichaceae bacterium]
MSKFLISHFIRNPDDITNEKTRYAYGFLVSMCGIICNLFLFGLKLISGYLMNSISIMSDGFNNLSDCMSCLITLFGYKLSAKPADKEHPFGHGRMEYVVSFVVAIIIFVVTFELFTESVRKIIHPETVTFNLVLFLLLAASILVKLWLSSLNKRIGKKIDNIAMLTTAQDSRNDVYVTLISLAAMVLSAFTKGFPFDGIAGIILSLFLLYSGYSIAKEIISRLLGTPADPQLVKSIKEQILSHPEILGVHDMIIHDYGPGCKIGSAHAEIDSHMNIMTAHDVIDQAEREVQEHQHVMMTLHLDPLDMSDPKVQKQRQMMEEILHEIDPMLSMHDFRSVIGTTHTNLVFDVNVPFDCKLNDEEIQQKIDDKLKDQKEKYYTVITFDRGFVSEY